MANLPQVGSSLGRCRYVRNNCQGQSNASCATYCLQHTQDEQGHVIRLKREAHVSNTVNDEADDKSQSSSTLVGKGSQEGWDNGLRNIELSATTSYSNPPAE